jgi:transposase, IS30 family
VDIAAGQIYESTQYLDPQSRGQRGSNENTNGLLRQYLPKGCNLSIFSQEELNKIASRLNQRPRRTLDFYTPAEVLSESLQLAE